MSFCFLKVPTPKTPMTPSPEQAPKAPTTPSSGQMPRTPVTPSSNSTGTPATPVLVPTPNTTVTPVSPKTEKSVKAGVSDAQLQANINLGILVLSQILWYPMLLHMWWISSPNSVRNPLNWQLPYHQQILISCWSVVVCWGIFVAQLVVWLPAFSPYWWGFDFSSCNPFISPSPAHNFAWYYQAKYGV